MEVSGGSCRFGLWHVHVWWSGDRIHRVRFSKTGIPGSVPAPFLQYCAGMPVDFSTFKSIAKEGDTLSARIYGAVQTVQYGSQATYGEIAAMIGTAPRVVGRTMAQNPTPLVVPCHRIVGARGLGGFTPDVEIKAALLEMERKGLKRWKGQGPDKRGSLH